MQEKDKQTIQIPVSEITHADYPEEGSIYRVPANLGKSFLKDASRLGRTREMEAKISTDETSTVLTNTD